MVDRLDVPLMDATLMEEVELVSALMIAASAAPTTLAQAQIDELLGLPPGARVPHQSAGRSEPDR